MARCSRQAGLERRRRSESNLAVECFDFMQLRGVLTAARANVVNAGLMRDSRL
jgi:hypothetical protein